MKIITKKEALENNLNRYFTGKPCKHGHINERYTVNSECRGCDLLRVNNPTYDKQRNSKYYQQNKNKILQKQAEYRQNNPDKLKTKFSNYRKSNRGLVNAKVSKQRATKLNRTVPWANLEKIKIIYKECEMLTVKTGLPHHVDHIIPLKGKYVSGLHVENNLQILLKLDNLRKSNNFKLE